MGRALACIAQKLYTSSCFSVCLSGAASPTASLARLASTEAGMCGPLTMASRGLGSATCSLLATSFTRLPCRRPRDQHSLKYRRSQQMHMPCLLPSSTCACTVSSTDELGPAHAALQPPTVGSGQ